MAPAGNTDARYSTFNKVQGDMYVVNININIQGRPGKLKFRSRGVNADCAAATDLFF